MTLSRQSPSRERPLAHSAKAISCEVSPQNRFQVSWENPLSQAAGLGPAAHNVTMCPLKKKVFVVTEKDFYKSSLTQILNIIPLLQKCSPNLQGVDVGLLHIRSQVTQFPTSPGHKKLSIWDTAAEGQFPICFLRLLASPYISRGFSQGLLSELNLSPYPSF